MAALGKNSGNSLNVRLSVVGMVLTPSTTFAYPQVVSPSVAALAFAKRQDPQLKRRQVPVIGSVRAGSAPGSRRSSLPARGEDRGTGSVRLRRWFRFSVGWCGDA